MLFPKFAYKAGCNLTEHEEIQLYQLAKVKISYEVALKQYTKHKNDVNSQMLSEIAELVKQLENLTSEIKYDESDLNIYKILAGGKLKNWGDMQKAMVSNELDSLIREYRTYFLGWGYGNKEYERTAQQLYDKIQEILHERRKKYQLTNKAKIFKNLYIFNSFSRKLAIEYGNLSWGNSDNAERYGLALLEVWADQLNNLGMQFKVIEENEDVICGCINGTIYYLRRVSGSQFKFYEKAKAKILYKGEIDKLSVSKFKQIYSVYVNTDYDKSIEKKYEINIPGITIHEIEPVDVIVKSNIKGCSNQKHVLADIIVKIGILRIDGKKGVDHLHASYCKQCNRYFILSNDYAYLSGIPTCPVYILEKGNLVKITENWRSFNNTESIIHSLGYNVNKKFGLSDIERHNILQNIIEMGEVSLGNILSYLDILIESHINNPRYFEAVRKWSNDRDFVSCIWNDNYIPEKNANSITNKKARR